MCCFSTPTEVSDTRIFARLTSPSAQMLVYQMRYRAGAPTAMILPLPVALPAGEGSVRWKNLEEAPTFFDDLASGFPAPAPRSIWGSKHVAAAVAPIEVHRVGDFIASFVPTVGDFDRIDPRFAIRRDVWNRIPAYADYGFAVFQLVETAGTPHPIAFEFDTRLRDTAYFPTVHIHDGTVHAEDTFDHLLYVQDRRLDASVGDYQDPDRVDPGTGMVRSKTIAAGIKASLAGLAASSGVLDGALLLHRMRIVGAHPNVDTLVHLVARASPVGCGACATDAMNANAAGVEDGRTRLGAAPAVLAGLAWLIRRRDALR